MTRAAFDTLLAEAQALHRVHPALHRFCAFAEDLRPTEVTPYPHPAADLMAADPLLSDSPPCPLAQGFLDAAPLAHWREPYKDTDIGQDFKDRFGCYCLIGPDGAWDSDSMYAFVVYMPPGLYYPWHHHPAEELYCILAGEAQFLAEGHAPRMLGPGDSVFHASGQSHATQTFDSPLLAYVLWRSHLETPPMLTERELVQ